MPNLTLALLTCWQSLAFPPGLNATSHAVYIDSVEVESHIREQAQHHVYLVRIPDDGQTHSVHIQARLDERVSDGDPALIQCVNACDLNQDGVTGILDFGQFSQQFGWTNDGLIVTGGGE